MTPTEKPCHEPLEDSLAKMLRLGSAIAAGLITSGILVMLTGNEATANGLIVAGLITLMATPVMRVVVAGVVFVRDKDWRFAFFCLVVICSILVGIFMGRSHGG